MTKKSFLLLLISIVFFNLLFLNPELVLADWSQEAHDAQHTGYTDEDIRAFLTSRSELQTLFALNLENGGSAFIPAVGAGGDETPVEKDIALETLPVVKRFANGDEVVYILWRNGQKCQAGDYSDTRWDTVMGEMVLGNYGKNPSQVTGYHDPVGDGKINGMDLGHVIKDWP